MAVYGWSGGQSPTSGWSGYYNPQSNYGWPYGGDPSTMTEISGPSGYIEQNPTVAWDQYIGSLGYNRLNPETAFAQWLQSQQPMAQRGYEVALTRNPLMTRQDYFRGLGDFNAWRQRFQQLSPAQRGENNWGQYAPRVRTLAR